MEVHHRGRPDNLLNREKTVSIVGGVIEKAAAKAILGDIDGFLSSLDGFDDVEVADGPKKEKVNGLMQSWYEGTASVKTDNGESVNIEWDMTIIRVGAETGSGVFSPDPFPFLDLHYRQIVKL
jgi:hypothetical protein